MKKLIAAAGIGAALTIAPLLGAGTASADPVTICAANVGGYGVVGGHTSCAFAANIRSAYQASGGMQHFVAYSPATGDRYYVGCESTYVNFASGGSAYAQQCYAGDNAEVVIW